MIDRPTDRQTDIDLIASIGSQLSRKSRWNFAQEKAQIRRVDSYYTTINKSNLELIKPWNWRTVTKNDCVNTVLCLKHEVSIDGFYKMEGFDHVSIGKALERRLKMGENERLREMGMAGATCFKFVQPFVNHILKSYPLSRNESFNYQLVGYNMCKLLIYILALPNPS